MSRGITSARSNDVGSHSVAVSSEVTASFTTGEPLGCYARHYYDLAQLSQQPEVVAMLESDEYAIIKSDYDVVSQTIRRTPLRTSGRSEFRKKRGVVSR